MFTLGVATPGVDRGKVQLLLLRTSRTNKLPSWSTVLPEKLTAAQLLKKLPAFYATRRFITAVSKAQHLSLSWARSIQSIPTSHISKIYFNIIFQQRTSLKLLKKHQQKIQNTKETRHKIGTVNLHILSTSPLILRVTITSTISTICFNGRFKHQFYRSACTMLH